MPATALSHEDRLDERVGLPENVFMDPGAMEPFGEALQAYIEGDTDAQLIIHRDDGQAAPVPVSVFFREPPQFTPIDLAALARCAGRVLDVGAGTGLHSLALQARGLSVTAIDVNPAAVQVMRARGVVNVCRADIFEFKSGLFDTVLMMGHGVGMVESLSGLDRFLAKAQTLIADGGQMLLDSLDVRQTDDPANLAYHDANRRVGRYIGEIRINCEFQGRKGPPCGWLQVDPDTLAARAAPAGWQCEVVAQDEHGNHLSRLTRR